MWSRTLPLLVAACILAVPTGTARIRSSNSAPWKPGKVEAFWIQSTDSSESYATGQGIAFLVESETVDCAMLLEPNLFYDADVDLGNGFLILVTFEAYSEYAEVIGDVGFEGLYQEGGSYAINDDVYVQMAIYSLYDGFLSYLTGAYGLGSTVSWVRIDSATETEVEGAFFTETWQGEFNATNCGEIEETTGPSDTGNTYSY